MLQAIRGQAASWIVKILFVLLIISFAAWGVADWLRSATHPTEVAEIGPVRIEPDAFSRAVSQEMQRFRQALGANFNRDQAKQFGLADRVIEEMVERTLLELEARRIGVTISDAVVRESIENNPAFKDESGKFDRNKFEAIVSRAGYSEDGFIAEIRHDLERTQLVRPILAGAEPPQAMVDAMLRYRGERRVAETFLVSRASVGAIAAPTDAQLEDYLKANSARFTRPEFRTLSYFTLSPADRAKQIEVSDADAKAAYQSRLDEFTTPEQRTVEQLLLPDEAAANQAAAEIAAGKSFEAVAKEHGKSADDIKFGSVKRDDLPAEFAGPVFDLAVDGVTKPIKSGFGWHIFTVTSITPQHVEPFEAVKQRVIDEVKLDKAGDEVPQLANQLEDTLAGGANLDDAAAKASATVRKTPPLDRQGQGVDGKKVPDLPTGDSLLSTAFGLTEGQTSRLVETGDDSYLVVRVDHVTPAALPPLAEIRAAVSDAWTKAQQDSAAKQRADGFVAQIKSGADIAKVAADAGAPVKTSAPVTRDGAGAGADLPVGLVGQLFGGPVGTVGVARTADGYVVGRLKEILPVDPATADAQRSKLEDQLRQALSGDLLQEFEAGLRDRFSVTINQKAVEQAL
ncbi:MAG TPA: peptidyl-prolyl cis-trans isomerase [Candidatus Sulfotelmatobacter sp.]|nr:peptidyl-prolyl cis-trans isomerase [Candidatus Sulfotelmatobacter sp.]